MKNVSKNNLQQPSDMSGHTHTRTFRLEELSKKRKPIKEQLKKELLLELNSDNFSIVMNDEKNEC